MATHTNKAFVTYGQFEALLSKKILDLLCPVGKDLILSYDLGDDYADKLAEMFPGTTWSGKTTVNIYSKISADDKFQLNNLHNTNQHSSVYCADGPISGTKVGTLCL